MANELIEREIEGTTSPDDSQFQQREFSAPGVGPDEAALYVHGLSKSFGRGKTAVPAVDNISFAVEPGEVIGLLGPNGAGKTTTFKSILGLILPDEGKVRIQGIDPYTRPRAAYEHVDAMFEGARNDYWRLTVRENLRYFAAIQGQNPDAVTDRHEALLTQLGVSNKADTQVRELSRGMKQKVSLASTLAADVSVAFLDEPTLGLDIETSLILRRELIRLADKRDMTLLISSHDMDLIQDVCDRVLIMNEGRIIANGTVETLLNGFTSTDYRLTAANVDATTISELCERFEVTSVERTDGRTHFGVTVDSKEFYRLIDVLERRGVELETVESVSPDLADVFVELIGGDASSGLLSATGRGGDPR